MNRKRFLSLALATALTLPLAACGDTSGTDGSDSSVISQSNEENSGSPEGDAGQADDSGSGSGDSVEKDGGSPETDADQADDGASDEGEGDVMDEIASRMDELLAQAETINWIAMGKAALDDVDGAEALYSGKTLLVKGTLCEINTDGLVKFRYYPAEDHSGKTVAYLWATIPATEAEYLDQTYMNQSVSIVGTVDVVNIEEGPVCFCIMEEAYLVSDTTEFVCTLTLAADGSYYEAEIEGWEGSLPLQVYFVDGQEVPVGEEVTIRGKLNRETGTEVLYDTFIVTQ